MSKFIIVKHQSPISSPSYTLHKRVYLFFKGPTLELHRLDDSAAKRGYDFEKIKKDGLVVNVSNFFSITDVTYTQNTQLIEDSIQYHVLNDAYQKKGRMIKKTRMTLAEIKLANLIDGK
jgi:hypothetical protein